jgi:hypothetical protein
MKDALDELIEILERLKRERNARRTAEVHADLVAARRIAADQSRQTGQSYAHFIDGDYDRAYGVRTALAAISYGRLTVQGVRDTRQPTGSGRRR